MAITRIFGTFVTLGAAACLAFVPGTALGATGDHGLTVSWSVAPIPPPDGIGTLTADAPQLSCTGTTFCAIMPSPGYLTTLTKAGASTVVAPHSPDPYSQDTLKSVACVTAGSCIAIGSTAEGPWDPLHVYRDLLNDGTWTSSDGQTSAFDQIACGTENCVAIGNVMDQGPFEARIDDKVAGGRWGSGTLTIPFAQADRPPDVTLVSATCARVGGCVALGYADGKNVPLRPVLFSHRGGGWQGVAEVFPAGANPSVAAGTSGAVAGMSCVASYNCIGLGQYVDRSTGRSHLFAEILHNGTLSAHALPLTRSAVGVTAGPMDCVSMTECAGVASWQGADNRTHAMLVRLHAGSWSMTPAPRPLNAVAGSSVTVNDVACAATSTCVAVGSYQVAGQSGSRPGEWIWTGGRWVAHGISSGMSATNQSLTSIECLSASKCTAVGVFDGQPVFGRATLVSG